MNQELRPVITNFARLGVLVSNASADPDTYAEEVERWRTTTLLFLDVSRSHAHDRLNQAKENRRLRHPAPAAYHELMTDLLLRAEREFRIVYVPHARGFDDLFDTIRSNGWEIDPPEDTEHLLVVLFQTLGWNHENAVRGLMLAGRFASI